MKFFNEMENGVGIPTPNPPPLPSLHLFNVYKVTNHHFDFNNLAFEDNKLAFAAAFGFGGTP